MLVPEILRGGVAELQLVRADVNRTELIEGIVRGDMLQDARRPGNGVVSDYSYHPQTLRLDRLMTTGPSGTLQDFTYGFDAVGNVTQITDAIHAGTQSFLYDDLDRLTRASGSYGVESYAYDALGNMTGKGTKTMQHGLPNRAKPHAVTASSDGRAFTYDANGNMRQCLATTGLTEAAYTFDAENRLVTVERPKTVTVSVHFAPGWNFFTLPVVL